jgi:hypothetical protein
MKRFGTMSAEPKRLLSASSKRLLLLLSKRLKRINA